MAVHTNQSQPSQSPAEKQLAARRDRPALLLCLLLPLFDLLWNLTHLNIGLEDFYGLAAFAQAASLGHWPSNAYFPAGYPLLLLPWGLLGSAVHGQGLVGHGVLAQGVLLGGYVYSALGIGLALAALYRLILLLEVPQRAALMLLVAAWLASPMRVIAGSPSVDALYTGLGLWFICAAVWLLLPESKESAPPQWFGLAVAATLLLATLRYHSYLLIVPVFLVLELLRAPGRVIFRRRPFAYFGVAFIVCFFLIGKGFAIGTPGAGELQVRSGLEMRYHHEYATSEQLWDNYAAFAEHGRAGSIFTDYSASEIAAHVLHNWWDYLRRAPILLMLGLWLPALILRRRIPHGVSIMALWVCLYSLALSPAYYTERAAALPLLAALALLYPLLRALIGCTTEHGPTPQRWRLALISTSLLLLAGLLWQEKSALADYATRRYYARASRELDDALVERGIKRSQVMLLDSRLLPLSDNTWCEPYRNVYGSWLDDPAIPPVLRAAIPPKLTERAMLSALSAAEQRGVNHSILIDWPADTELAKVGDSLRLSVEKVEPLFSFVRPLTPDKIVAGYGTMAPKGPGLPRPALLLTASSPQIPVQEY